MTGYTPLDNLLAALTGNSALMAMVGSNIFKNKAISASAVDLNGDPAKSQISCELSDLSGQILSADQVFVVDIRTRKETAGDGGAEYCAQIADAVRSILDDGFAGATVTKIHGAVAWDAILKGYRCRLEVTSHIKGSFSLSLTPNRASPQAAGSEIVLTAIASPNLGLEYRFLLNGPGTGNVMRDLSDWQSRNSFVWRTNDADVGASTILLEIRGGLNRGAADQSTSISYTITATSNAAPAITSLTPSLASPQPPGLEIELICTATDAEGNGLLYKFCHQPPGASYWKDLTGWQSQNWTVWRPTLADSGTNGLKVQVIDAKHAEKGGYDASSMITYTINPGITNVLTFYRVGSDDKVYYLVGTTWTLLSDQTVSRISVAPDGTIAAMDLATSALLIWNGSSWIALGGLLLHIVAISSTLVYGIGTDNNIWKNENGAWSLVHATYAKYMELIITDG